MLINQALCADLRTRCQCMLLHTCKAQKVFPVQADETHFKISGLSMSTYAKLSTLRTTADFAYLLCPA